MDIGGNKRKMSAITEGMVLHENAIYTLDGASRALGMPKATLPNEVRRGRLRASKRCGRYLVLGKWLLEWIEDGDKQRRDASKARRLSLGLMRGDDVAA